MSMKTILVTGGSGLVGSALQSIQKEYNYYFIFLNSKQVNLLNFTETKKVFCEIQPDIIIHVAASVGGLFKNIEQNVVLFEENITMNTNVIKAAHVSGVQRLIACLSTCIFSEMETLLDESMIHNGPPHSSNEGYAYAKRMLEVSCRLYTEKYNREYSCVIPTNIYGPHDNFNLNDGHVLPVLIHKAFLANEYSIPFEVKGSGKPLRQFIYSVDVANIILLLLEKPFVQNVILSPKEEVSISEVAEMINTHFINEIHYLPEYSDGIYKKTADNSKLLSIVNFEFTELKVGIKDTINWFIKNYPNVRA